MTDDTESELRDAILAEAKALSTNYATANSFEEQNSIIQVWSRELEIKYPNNSALQAFGMAALMIHTARQPARHEMSSRGERVAVFAFGVLFVAMLLVIAILVPEPTNFQYTVFRIVLALAAAGVAAFIPGFIHVEINKWLRAGGAIAVFVIVYFFSPAQLIVNSDEPDVPAVEVGGQSRADVRGATNLLAKSAAKAHPLY